MSKKLSLLSFIVSALALLFGWWCTEPIRELLILSDVSASIGDAQFSTNEYISEYLKQLNITNPQFFSFADKVIAPNNHSSLNRQQTNIAAALNFALNFPRSANRTQRRVLLITDGQENIGTAQNLAEKIPTNLCLEILPRSWQPFPDAKVFALQTPATTILNTPFTVNALVENNPAGEITLTLENAQGEILDQVSQKVTPAGAIIPLTGKLTVSGLIPITVRVQLNGDTIAENNFARAAIKVTPPNEIIWFGESAKIPDLQIVFSQAKFITTEILSRYRVVVINDLSAEDFLAQHLAALEKYLKHGGNLMVIGGENLVRSDWGKFAENFPLHFFPRETLAIILALDISGSMSENANGKPKIDNALRALRAGLQKLPETASAGIVFFSRTAQTMIPLLPINETAKKIPQLTANATGGTSIFAGIEKALAMLKNNLAPIRHIVLITDGETFETDDELTEKITATRAQLLQNGIGLSCVAIGAELPLLKTLTDKIGNVTLTDAQTINLPIILQNEIAEAQPINADETPIITRQKNIITENLPPNAVAKNYLTVGELRSTNNAQTWLSTPENRVLLAENKIGLGQCFWFSGNVWRDWRGGEKLFTQLSSWLLSTKLAQLSATVLRGEIYLQSNTPTIEISAVNENTSSQKFTLTPEIVGVYRGKIPVPENGLYRISNGEETIALQIDNRDEYRFFGVNTENLSKIAAATNGKIITHPQQLTTWENVPVVDNGDNNLGMIAFGVAILAFAVGLFFYERRFNF